MEPTREELERRIRAQERTIATLIEAAESGSTDPTSAVPLWNRMVDLDRVVREKTRELELALARNTQLLARQRESERFLRSTLDSLDAHIAILDRRGVIVAVNALWDEFARGNGGGDECGTGADYLGVCDRSAELGELDAAGIAEAIRSILAGERKLCIAEYECHSAAGERWFQARITPLELGAAEPGCVVAHIDITARRLAEREAEARGREAQRLALVAKFTDNGVLIADADGSVRWVNEGFTRITGYGPEELVGRPARVVLKGPDTDPGVVEQLERSLAEGSSCDVEVLHRHKRGPQYWVSLEVRPIRDERGELESFFVIESEITGRKQAERQLRDERALLREIITTIPYFVFWKDRGSKYLGCNQSFAHAAGLGAPEEIVGRSDYDMPWGRTEASSYRADDEYVMASGKAKLHIPERQLTPSGATIHLSTSKVPLRDERGEVIGIVGIYVDVTEQRMLEAQLSQANKLESIGQLAAGIAHEINTPTQYVGDNTRFLEQSFADLRPLLERADALARKVADGSAGDADARALLSAIEEADVEYLAEEIPRAIGQSLEGIERVSRIVSAMREFSHPSVDEKTPVDLNHAIESTVTVATNEWKYVAEVELDLDPELPAVPCLPGELNQVFLNMIVNAAHAIGDAVGDGGQGRGTIRVATRRDDDMVEVRIADTGAGIPPEVRSRVFDPFFTTKEVGKGTGQGLAIAHSVVTQKHGGTLTFESEVGVGTTFVVRLPLEEAGVDAEAAA